MRNDSLKANNKQCFVFSVSHVDAGCFFYSTVTLTIITYILDSLSSHFIHARTHIMCCCLERVLIRHVSFSQCAKAKQRRRRKEEEMFCSMFYVYSLCDVPLNVCHWLWNMADVSKNKGNIHSFQIYCGSCSPIRPRSPFFLCVEPGMFSFIAHELVHCVVVNFQIVGIYNDEIQWKELARQALKRTHSVKEMGDAAIQNEWKS